MNYKYDILRRNLLWHWYVSRIFGSRFNGEVIPSSDIDAKVNAMHICIAVARIDQAERDTGNRYHHTLCVWGICNNLPIVPSYDRTSCIEGRFLPSLVRCRFSAQKTILLMVWRWSSWSEHQNEQLASGILNNRKAACLLWLPWETSRFRYNRMNNRTYHFPHNITGMLFWKHHLWTSFLRWLAMRSDVRAWSRRGQVVHGTGNRCHHIPFASGACTILPNVHLCCRRLGIALNRTLYISYLTTVYYSQKSLTMASSGAGDWARTCIVWHLPHSFLPQWASRTSPLAR